MERIAMSQEERDCLEWLKRAKDKVVTQKVAAEKMGVSERWVRSLLVEMQTKGDAMVIHTCYTYFMAQLNLYVPDEEAAHLRIDAKKAGLTLSKYVVDLLDRSKAMIIGPPATSRRSVDF